MWMAIDTSADRCSVALETAAGLLVRETDAPRQHARSVAPFMQELMAEAAGGSPTGVVVVAGPGSYTGLRIGVSSAKGLCFALDIPLYALSTLEYLASSAVAAGLPADAPVIAVERARRGELHVGGRGLPDQVMEDDDFRAYIAAGGAEQNPTQNPAQNPVPPILVVRHPQLAEELKDGDFVAPERIRIVHPDARNAIHIVRSAPHSYLVRDMGSFEPFYLKDFIARA